MSLGLQMKECQATEIDWLIDDSTMSRQQHIDENVIPQPKAIGTYFLLALVNVHSGYPSRC